MELHSGKLTWQWKMDPLKMIFRSNMGIFHCYVSLPEGKGSLLNGGRRANQHRIGHFSISNGQANEESWFLDKY